MTCNNLIEFFKEFSVNTSYFTNSEFTFQYRVGYKIFTDIKDIKQRYSKLFSQVKLKSINIDEACLYKFNTII